MTARTNKRWLAAVAIWPMFTLAGCEVVAALAPIAGSLLASAMKNHGHTEAGEHINKLIERVQSPTASPVLQPATPASATAPIPIEIDLQLLKLAQTDEGFDLVPIRDGDTLLHRVTLEDSDAFKVFVRSSVDCHLYVINVDATGWVNVLHPEDGRSANIRAGRELLLPEGGIDVAFAVDGHVGKETVYFIASREPRRDLEQVLLPLVGAERPPLQNPASVDNVENDNVEFGVASRSVGRSGQTTVGARSVQFDTEAFLGVAGADVVATRWFWHRKDP